MPGVKRLAIVAVRDVDASVPSDGVRIDGGRRRDAMLPLLLHLGVHHEQRVMRQVDSDLTLGVGVVVAIVLVVFIPGHDTSHAELSRHAEREGSDDGARAEVCELVAVLFYLER